jgi:colanic acid biosynthesis glycosyl transferase WcaI
MTRSRRRVFFVNRYFFPDESATSQLLSDLAFGLAEFGLDVRIVCSRQLYGAPETKLPAVETIRGVTVHRLWTTRFGRDGLVGRAIDYLTFYVACAITLARQLRKSDVVVAKTDPPLISVVAAAAARLKGAILINWLQDVFPEVATALGVNPLPASIDRLLRRLRDASLRAAAANVVLGSRMRDYLQTRGVPADKIQIIENWADIEAAHPKPALESALRARLGFAGKFIVSYSGNLGRAHEFQTILDAATALSAEDDFLFLMIGAGAGMTQLQQAVRNRGLPNFQFLPYQPRAELKDSLAAADVHWVSLLPSLEGLIVPSKFYGILAAGRPVVFIGDPDGELARVIRASDVGVVVGVGDSDALVGELLEFRRRESRRLAMGRNGCTLCRQSHTVQRAVRRWIDLIDSDQDPA